MHFRQVAGPGAASPGAGAEMICDAWIHPGDKGEKQSLNTAGSKDFVVGLFRTTILNFENIYVYFY